MNVEAAGAPETTGGPKNRWYHKASSVLFAIFCFEMGSFFLVFPWTELWRQNYFSGFPGSSLLTANIEQWWPGFWMSPYLRGAFSGLGLLNIYISIVEVFRLRRFSEAED